MRGAPRDETRAAMLLALHVHNVRMMAEMVNLSLEDVRGWWARHAEIKTEIWRQEEMLQVERGLALASEHTRLLKQHVESRLVLLKERSDTACTEKVISLAFEAIDAYETKRAAGGARAAQLAAYLARSSNPRKSAAVAAKVEIIRKTMELPEGTPQSVSLRAGEAMVGICNATPLAIETTEGLWERMDKVWTTHIRNKNGWAGNHQRAKGAAMLFLLHDERTYESAWFSTHGNATD